MLKSIPSLAVDDLAQERAGLHVVIGVLEGGADEQMARCGAFELLEAGRKVVVD